MTRIALIGLALAIAAACTVNNHGDDDDNGPGRDGGTGSGTDGGPDSGSPGTPISPSAGLWTYRETTPVSSTCRTDVAHFEGGNFVIDQVVSAGFRIVPGDGTSPFTCSSNGAQFNCPDRIAFVQDNRPSVDAVLTVHGTVTGTLSDTTHGTGQQAATVDCVGTQCALFGTLPCQFTVSFVIQKF
jgi:hypothetical protein